MGEEETDVLSVLRDHSKSPNITPSSALQSLGIDLTRMEDAAYLNQLNPTQKEAVAIIGERTGTMGVGRSADPIGKTKLPVTETPEVPKDLQLPRVESVMSGAITGDMPPFAKQYFKDMKRGQGNMSKGLTDQAKGQFDAQKFQSDKNTAVAAVKQVRADYQANQIQATADAEEIRSMAANQSRQAIDTANKMVTNFEIDPRRLYKESYNAFGSAIAVALGQFGASLTGGPNTAFQIIDRAVSRDIAAQRTQLDTLKFGAQQKVNAYSRLMDAYKDERIVENLMREQMNTALLGQIEQIESKYQGKIDLSGLQMIKGEVQQRQAKSDMDITTQLYNAGMKVWSENNRRSEARAAASAKKLAAAKDQETGFADADAKTRNKIQGGIASMLLINEIEGMYADLEHPTNWVLDTGPLGGALNSLTPMRTDKDRIRRKLDELGQQLVLIKSGVVARADEREIEELKLPSTLKNFDTQLGELNAVKTNMRHQIDSIYFVLSDHDKKHFLKTMGPLYKVPKIPDARSRATNKAGKKKAQDAKQIEKLLQAIKNYRAQEDESKIGY